MKSVILASTLILSVGTTSANAAVVFDTILGATQAGLNDVQFVGGGSPLGNSFHVNGSGQVETISFSLGAKTPTDGGSVLVFIVPDMNGLPAHYDSTTNLLGASLLGTIPDSSLMLVGSGNPALPTTTITTQFNVLTGTYWIVLVDAADSGNGGLALQSTSAVLGYNKDGHGIGTLGQSFSNNSAGMLTATPDEFGPYRLTITGTVELIDVAEPSSLLVMGSGLWGLWLRSRRRVGGQGGHVA